MLPGVEQTLPHDGLREIPFGCSASVRLRYSSLVAKIGQRVLIAAAAPRASPAYVSSRRAWPIRSSERLASAEVLFERGRVADPLAETLTEHEARIAEPQQVLEQSGGVHRFLTSSGIVVERRVPVDLVARRLEQRIGIRRIGRDDVGVDGTTQMLTPSWRRV